MRNFFIPFLSLFASLAVADINLAVVSTSGAVDGAPWSDSRSQKYAKPLPADLVRDQASGKAVQFGKLLPSAIIEVCGDDVPDGTPSVNGSPCTRWPWLAASAVPAGAVGPTDLVTATAGAWQLYKGTAIKSKDHASETICIAAARLDAISAKASGDYLCKTSTDVNVKLIAAPVIPPIVPPVVDAGKSIKWHPGNYAWFIPSAVNGISGYRLDVHVASYLSFTDSICGESTLRGIQIVVYPKALEADAAGDYSPGFRAVDAILARLKGCNKYLMLSYQSTVFGNYASTTDVWPGSWAPLGLTQIGKNGVYAGRAARVWQRPTTERVLAMAQAYGARYNANPNFEMLTLGETAIQVDAGVDGFSNRAVLDELRYLLPKARAAWPNTGLRVSVNDLHPDPLMQELIEFCTTIPCALGGPDIWPYDVTQADRIFAGLDANGKPTLKDYRDLLPWAIEAQWQSFGGQFSMAQLWNATVNGYTASNGFVMPSMKTKYLIWYVNEANGTAATRWSTATLPYIKSVNGAVSSTTCPKLYSACMN